MLVTIPGLAVTTVLILALTTVPAVVSEGQGGGGVKGTMIVLPEGASVDDVFDPVTDNAVQDDGYAYNIEENISTLIHCKGAEILFFHMLAESKKNKVVLNSGLSEDFYVNSQT